MSSANLVERFPAPMPADEVVAVLADLCCRVPAARHVPLRERAPDAVISTIAALTGELLTEAQRYGVGVRGLAVAVSVHVDRVTGVVRYSPFVGWRNVALAGLAETATGLPAMVDNDVRALTVAEQWFGTGSGGPTSRCSRSGRHRLRTGRPRPGRGRGGR